jgi:glycosyltransferase involved in cell wall biosynthesis
VSERIVDCGWVDVSSDQFISLASKCRFVLLPSCAEATASAVVTCMRFGIIPIVSSGLGFDSLDGVFILRDYKVDYLVEVISNIVCMSDDTLRDISERIYRYSNRCFSLEAFKTDFYTIMDELTLKKGCCQSEESK